MTKSELLKRIEDLEQRVTELEERQMAVDFPKPLSPPFEITFGRATYGMRCAMVGLVSLTDTSY